MYYHPTRWSRARPTTWRVDEIEGDGVTVHQGDVWSFTTQALTATVPTRRTARSTRLCPHPDLAARPDRRQHQVYFGASQDAVAKGDKSTDRGRYRSGIHPGDLQEARQYYWRIDEIAADGAVRTGPVWAFRTFVQVDDFEKYTAKRQPHLRDLDRRWTNATARGSATCRPLRGTEDRARRQAVHAVRLHNTKAPYLVRPNRTFRRPKAAAAMTSTPWSSGPGPAHEQPGDVVRRAEGRARQVGVVSHPDPAILTLSKWTECGSSCRRHGHRRRSHVGQEDPVRRGQPRQPAAGGADDWLDDIHAIKALGKL